MSEQKTNGSGGMREHAARVLAEQERQRDATQRDMAAAREAERSRLTADDAETVTLDQLADSLDFEQISGDMWADAADLPRLDSAIAMRDFFPEDRSADTNPLAYAQKTIVPRGRGTTEVVGALAGVVRGWTDGVTTFNNGKDESPWIRLEGEFVAQSKLTGERMHAAECYLPYGYAKRLREQLRAQLHGDLAPEGIADGVTAITFNVLVTIEATGKTVSYRYGIRSRIRVPVSRQLQDLLAEGNRNVARRITGGGADGGGQASR